MRIQATRIFLAVALLAFLLPASAQAATVNYNCGTSGTYQVDNVTNRITGHTSCSGTLNIQSGVVSIADWAFANNANLTTITFPTSLTTIGTGAFSGATFTGINFSEGLTTIGVSAFSSSVAQIAMNFPDSLVTISDRAFEQGRFTSFSFGPNISTFGHTLAYNNFGYGAERVEFRGGSPLITSIGGTSFIGFRGTEFPLPTRLTSIGGRAFEGASNLRYIIVPDSVTSIAASAFTPTSSLKTVVLPNALTTLGTTVFGSAIETVVYCGSTSAVQNYAYPNSIVPVCGKAAIFDRNEGTGSMTTQVGSTPTGLNANTFTRSGYVFTGWNTKANGTGASYINGGTYDFASHTVLYAQWAIPDITPPSFLTSRSQSKPENQTEVANILVSEAATILIKGGSDQAKFRVSRVADSASALSFIEAPNFESPTDSDANNTYIVVLSAMDNSFNSTLETFTVTITDAGEQIAIVASTINQSLQKGVSTNFSLTFDNAVRATMLYNGKRISGCISKRSASTSPFTYTCSYKPSLQGSGRLTVSYQEISGINFGGVLSLGTIAVGKRSNKR